LQDRALVFTVLTMALMVYVGWTVAEAARA
jgi:hypothetical protein